MVDLTGQTEPMVREGDRIGRYEMVRQIGQGGMGEVYLARHVFLNSFHALKLVRPGSVVEIRRVIREARAQAQLHHPNVVPVTDVLDMGPGPALVMDYVPGPDLFRLVQYQRLTLAQADRIAQGAMGGLGRAHDFGLVHRDFKPANILIGGTPADPIARVSDFGVVQDALGTLRETRDTMRGVSIGTPCFTAPEQLEDARQVDERADIFSLGASLFYLVTGRRPFSYDDGKVDLISLFAGRCADPRDYRSDIPAEWSEIILQCVGEHPVTRPASVAEVRRVWTRAGYMGPVEPLPWSWSHPALVARMARGRGGPPALEQEDSLDRAILDEDTDGATQIEWRSPVFRPDADADTAILHPVEAADEEPAILLGAEHRRGPLDAGVREAKSVEDSDSLGGDRQIGRAGARPRLSERPREPLLDTLPLPVVAPEGNPEEPGG